MIPLVPPVPVEPLVPPVPPPIGAPLLPPLVSVPVPGLGAGVVVPGDEDVPVPLVSVDPAPDEPVVPGVVVESVTPGTALVPPGTVLVPPGAGLPGPVPSASTRRSTVALSC